MSPAYRAKQGSDVLQLPVRAQGGMMAMSDVIQLVLIRWRGGGGGQGIHTYLIEAQELFYWITNALGKPTVTFIK